MNMNGLQKWVVYDHGWSAIMYHAVDSTEMNKFLISLYIFVDIIFDNFVTLRDETTGVAMLTRTNENN